LQVLIGGGVPADNIVVIAMDDLLNAPENPAPGALYNRPGGPDVARGLKIDYRGENATADVFYDVLAGNTAELEGKGSGRALAAGPEDR
jgi:legumain